MAAATTSSENVSPQQTNGRLLVNHDGALLAAGGYELEEEVGGVLVERDVSPDVKCNLLKRIQPEHLRLITWVKGPAPLIGGVSHCGSGQKHQTKLPIWISSPVASMAVSTG